MKVSQKFNSMFYDIAVIKEALSDFSKICTGKIEKKGDYFHVVLKPKTKIEDINKVGLEFRNYVLGLMKNKMLI